MNEGVTENLKAIKVLHQLLMAVTAAVSVFILRPDLTQEYKNSLDELAALKQVSWGAWSNYVAHRYQNELDQDNKFLRSWIHQGGVHVRNMRRVRRFQFSATKCRFREPEDYSTWTRFYPAFRESEL